MKPEQCITFFFSFRVLRIFCLRLPVRSDKYVPHWHPVTQCYLWQVRAEVGDIVPKGALIKKHNTTRVLVYVYLVRDDNK